MINGKALARLEMLQTRLDSKQEMFIQRVVEKHDEVPEAYHKAFGVNSPRRAWLLWEQHVIQDVVLLLTDGGHSPISRGEILSTLGEIMRSGREDKDRIAAAKVAGGFIGMEQRTLKIETDNEPKEKPGLSAEQMDDARRIMIGES